MTGADFSPAAITLARELAIDLGFPDARFVESNLYDLPANLDGTFDVVYTSRGVLNWLPDVRRWAEVVAHVRQAGRRCSTSARSIRSPTPSRTRASRRASSGCDYPYWEHQRPIVFDVQGSYADPTADVGVQKGHAWDHGLGEIVTALIDAGLRLEWLRESPELDWGVDFLVETAPGSGRYRLPEGTRASCRSCSRCSRASLRPEARYSSGSLPRERTSPSIRQGSGGWHMVNHARFERDRRAAESARIKEIEAAWLGSLTPAVAKAFNEDVARARARAPQPPPEPMAPAPGRTRPARVTSREPTKEERKRSRPFGD